MQQTITEDPSSPNRNEAVMTLWMHAAHISTIFHDATNLIIHKLPINHTELLSRAQTTCGNYQAWWRSWHVQYEDAASKMSLQISESEGLLIRTLCSYLEQFCLINRLLLALNPAEGIEPENVIVKTAQRLLEIYSRYTQSDQPEYSLLLSKFVAETVLGTTSRWKEVLSGCSMEKTIDPDLFRSWCIALQRKVD